MKNKKIHIVLLSALVLGLILSVSGLAAGALASSSARSGSVQKTTVYEYALLGDTYNVGSGLVSATTPKGESIPADTESVFLNWASGSYIFEYESRIVNLKVYEKAPEDKISLSSAVPASAAEGKETVFPSIEVISGIQRTDGAPEVGSYQVDAVFWYNGNKVKTFKNITEDFKYTFGASGFYVLSYEYTDVFGAVRNIDHNIMVISERIIVSSLAQKYYVGGTVTSSEFYGYYDGKRYAANVEITPPDSSTVTMGSSYVFDKVGSYAISVSSLIDGVSVTDSYTVEVSSGLQSFIGSSTGFGEGLLTDSYSTVNNAVGTTQGVLFDMTASSAQLSYNGIINLNSLGKDTPLISFTPNHSYGGSISKVTVTLTDIYNSNNSVTVQFSKNANTTETTMSYDNTAVKVGFGSITTAVNNYYPEKNASIGWETTFNTFWRSPANTNPNKTYPAADSMDAMNFSFDTETNTVYTYGKYHLVEWGTRATPEGYPTGTARTWYPIADLDSSSLAMQFAGFTTGEVYLTLKVESGRGDIMIHSIGGVSVNNLASGYNTNDAISIKGYDEELPAALGIPYQLPTGKSAYISELTRKLYFDGEELEITGDSFTPTQLGVYSVVYEGINQFGRKVNKTLQITCIEKPDIAISYETEDVKIGDIYTVKAPLITGYGKISYSIFVNGERLSAGDRIVVTSDLEIKIQARDAIESGEAVFNITADKDVVEYSVEFPRAALSGSSFTFPEAKIYDYLTAELLAYDIYVDDVKQGDSMVLPSDRESIDIEYRTARGSKVFTLYLRASEVTDGAGALILPEGAAASSGAAGTTVTVSSEAPTVMLPYMLSTTNFEFRFIVLEQKLNFKTMTVRMTDKNGYSVEIAISGLKGEAPTLLLNGVDTSVKVTKTAQVYNEGEYSGETYYAFKIEYNDYYKALIDSSRPLATLENYDNGLAFSGFGGGVYLDIIPQDLDTGAESAEYIITKVSNQFFYASAFEYGDIMGPAISTTDFAMVRNNYVEDGFVLKLSDIRAFDVLTGNSSVKVSLTLSDGSRVYQSLAPEELEDVVLSGIGLNTLKIVASDGTATTTSTYYFVIEDISAPVIDISGSVASTANRGDTLVLPSASVTDNSETTVKIFVYAPTGDTYTLASGEGSLSQTDLLIEFSGVYIIRYVATDEAGNISTEVFRIKAEG